MNLADLLANLRSLNSTLPRNPDEPPGDPILFDDTANADGSRGVERICSLVTSPITPWLTDALASGAFNGIAPRCKDSLPPLSHHLRTTPGNDARTRFRLLVDWLRGNGDMQSHGPVTGLQLADAIESALRTSPERPLAGGETKERDALSNKPIVAMSSGPWHPCHDGLTPIAEALERFVEAKVIDLPKRIQYSSTQPSRELANAFNEPGMGPGTRSGSRREMVRRWLQFHGFVADAAEFDKRLQEILDDLRAWQERAMHDVPPADSTRVFSDPVCDAHGEVVGKAMETSDYLRQLAAMTRAKLAKIATEPGRAGELASADTAVAPEGTGVSLQTAASMEVIDIANRIDEWLVGDLAARNAVGRLIDVYEQMEVSRKQARDAWREEQRQALRNVLFDRRLQSRKAGPPGWVWHQERYCGEVPWSKKANDYRPLASAVRWIIQNSSVSPRPAPDYVERELRKRVEANQIRYMRRGEQLRVNITDARDRPGIVVEGWLPKGLIDEPPQPDAFGAIEDVMNPRPSPLAYKAAWLAMVHDTYLPAAALFAGRGGMHFKVLGVVGSDDWTVQAIATVRAFLGQVKASIGAAPEILAGAASKAKKKRIRKAAPKVTSRRGRPPKTEPDAIDKVADKIIAGGLNARCSYPALVRQFVDQLPQGATASALRHRVLRRRTKERAKKAPKK